MTKAMSWMMVALVGFILFGARVLAGGLDTTTTPTNASGAMFTLNDVYNKLDNQGNTVTKRTGAFTDPVAGPTNGTMHTFDDIMLLVTNRAPIIKGMFGSPVGVAAPNPRFVRESSVPGSAGYSNIIDRLTGLMWTANTSPNGSTNWNAQSTYCFSLNWGGYGNHQWRIPSRGEYMTIFGTTNIDVSLASPAPSGTYWAEQKFGNSSYIISSLGIWSDAVNKTNFVYNCWPVRGGQ